MECIACNRAEAKRKNPNGMFRMDFVSHTCNQPDHSKREYSMVSCQKVSPEVAKVMKDRLDAYEMRYSKHFRDATQNNECE